MDSKNYFIVPPPQTNPGDYTFSANIQYGSTQHFSWTDNYNISLDLVLVQETYFLHDDNLPLQLDTLACIVPSLPLPVDPGGES